MAHSTGQWLRRHVWVSGAIALGVVAFVCGVIGWRVDGRGWPESIYNTLGFFVLDGGDPVGGVTGWLWVARFLAPAATVSSIVAIIFRVLHDGWVRWRAVRAKDHVVVLGGGPEAAEIAVQFRDQHPVVYVGAATAAEQIELAAARVRRLEAASDAQLRNILNKCTKVVITAPDDQEASSLTSRVQGICRELEQDPVVISLVDSRDVAQDWRSIGNDRVVCRAEQVARTVLGKQAPFDERRVTPAPLVLGDGRIAAELTARIFEGWQLPGETITVHCGGPEAARTHFVERGLAFADGDVPAGPRRPTSAQGLGTLVWHELPAGTHHVGPLAESVLSGWTASWLTYRRHADYEVGPMPVYVAFDDDAVTIPVANAVKRALGEQVKVVVVPKERELAEHLCAVLVGKEPPTEDRLIREGVHLQPQTAMLCSPEELDRALTDILADELEAELERWPKEIPSLYDAAAVDDVAQTILAAALAAGFEVVSAPLPASRVMVFTAEELDEIATALGGRIPPDETRHTPWERRTLLLELAGRLPALLNRAGRALQRKSKAGDLIPFDRLEELAAIAHAFYQEVAAETGNATGSQFATVDYHLLPEFERSSNAAQVLDIPVKLAMLGLKFVPRPDPSDGRPDPVRYQLNENTEVEVLGYQEHRRWSHFQMRSGRNSHNWNKPWAVLGHRQREYDRQAARVIPILLDHIDMVLVADPDRRSKVPKAPELKPAQGRFWRIGEVNAERLTKPRTWTTSNGDELEAAAGDWWVQPLDAKKPDGRSVKPEAFARTYELIDGNRYRRIGFVDAVQVMERTAVLTDEGPAHAEQYDWVITDGDSTWPVSDDAFKALYDSAPPKASSV